MRYLLIFCLMVASAFAAPPPGYTLAYDREFSNSRLNLNVLIPSNAGWGPGGITEYICHTPSGSDFGSSYFSGPHDAGDGISPFRIDPSGHLRIKCWFDSTINHLRSGLLSTMGDTGAGFAMANGYYQVSVWVPRAGGTWPSFWMETANTFTRNRTTNATEIDVFEIYGDQAFANPKHTSFTTIAHQTVHEWSPTGIQIGPGVGFAATETTATGQPIDFACGFHTFGCLINGASIIFDIDNIQTFTTTMPPSGLNAAFYMMVDLAMGGGWPINDNPKPSPNANPPGYNSYPQELVIQFIRCYAPPVNGQ